MSVDAPVIFSRRLAVFGGISLVGVASAAAQPETQHGSWVLGFEVRGGVDACERFGAEIADRFRDVVWTQKPADDASSVVLSARGQAEDLRQRILRTVPAVGQFGIYLVLDDETDGERPNDRARGIVKRPDPTGRHMLTMSTQPLIRGADVASVKAGVGASTGQPHLLLRFTQAGRAAFAAATRDHVGRRFAVVLGERVLLAPVVTGEITGGMAEVQGGFSMAEAIDFAAAISLSRHDVQVSLIAMSAGP